MPKTKSPPKKLPASDPIKEPHTPGPWAPIATEDKAFEVWTTMPSGTLACLAKILPGSKAKVDANLMAAAPQLAHEVRAVTALLESIVSTPNILDALVESTQNTDLEATLLHRLGCLRRLATLVGPALAPGTYEPSPLEARWHVPEHTYRARESAEEPDD